MEVSGALDGDILVREGKRRYVRYYIKACYNIGEGGRTHLLLAFVI